MPKSSAHVKVPLHSPLLPKSLLSEQSLRNFETAIVEGGFWDGLDMRHAHSETSPSRSYVT